MVTRTRSGEGPRSSSAGDDPAATDPRVDFEPRWPMRLALVAAIVLYAFLPDQVLLGPRLIVPVVEGVLFVVLWALAPRRHHSALPHVRAVALVLVALISMVNIVNLGFLVRELLTGSGTTGKTLILGAIDIWLTNVIAFGFWYWEMDSGGPVARIRGDGRRRHDFLFPQQANPDVAPRGWRPLFFDYLYTSFTNATAFSPTDTMPLSRVAKALMMAQSGAALVTISLLAARAVNILT